MNPTLDNGIRLQLGIYEPYPQQDAFLRRVGRVRDGKMQQTRTHFQAGRGSGKTAMLAKKAFDAVHKYNPNVDGLITTPTYKHVEKTLLPAFRALFPDDPNIFNFNRQNHILTFAFNQRAKIFIISRSDEDDARGPNFGWGIHDEIAMDRSLGFLTNASAAIRAFCEHPFNDDTSTPKKGLYAEYISRGENNLAIKATSFDNPYIDENWLASLKENYSDEEYRQEVLGEIIALAGRAWKDFDYSQEWPLGSKHWAVYDERRPWFLACDPGITGGAYLIMQSYPAETRYGAQIFDGHVDVVVAEYQPQQQAVRETLERISSTYRNPPRDIYIGSDVNTKSYIEGTKIADIIKGDRLHSGIWPRAKISWPSWYDSHKSVQYDRLSGLIKSSKEQRNRRRFCVSSKLKSHDRSVRGILGVMDNDEFPAKAQPRGGMLPNTDRDDPMGLRHTRDAAMYYAVCKYPQNG